MAAGGLGVGDESEYGKRKTRLAKAGRRDVTSEYGIPVPVGIRTGRFVEGIRSRWRRGRRE
jgi:ribosomal protein L39E